MSATGGNTGGQSGTVGVFDTSVTPMNFTAGHSWYFESGDGPLTLGAVTLDGTDVADYNAGLASTVYINSNVTAASLDISSANVTVSDGVVVTAPAFTIGDPPIKATSTTVLTLAPTAVLDVDNFTTRRLLYVI